MGDVIGQVLPLALGIAISPIPIIAAILMLLSGHARAASIGFLLGWVAGIVAACAVFTALASSLPEQGPATAKPIVGVVQLVLGAALLVLAALQWRKRAKPGAEPPMPKWMHSITGVRFLGAFGLGFLLAAVNPKNLLLAMSAGTAIGTAGLDLGSIVVVIAIHTLIACSTILVPVVAYLFAANRLQGLLDRLQHWLTRENAVIMAVLLLVMGVSLIGKGIGHL